MPNFLDLAAIAQKAAFMNNLTYDKLSDLQVGYLLTHTWQAVFIDPPPAVYFPGQEVIDSRLDEVDPGLSNLKAEMAVVKVRGFSFLQPYRKFEPVTINMTFKEREDLSIYLFLKDWLDKIMDHKTRMMLRKPDVVMKRLNLVLLNNIRVPVMRISLFTVILESLNFDLKGEGEPKVRTDLKATFKAEYFEIDPLNI